MSSSAQCRPVRKASALHASLPPFPPGAWPGSALPHNNTHDPARAGPRSLWTAGPPALPLAWPGLAWHALQNTACPRDTVPDTPPTVQHYWPAVRPPHQALGTRGHLQAAMPICRCVGRQIVRAASLNILPHAYPAAAAHMCVNQRCLTSVIGPPPHTHTVRARRPPPSRRPSRSSPCSCPCGAAPPRQHPKTPSRVHNELDCMPYRQQPKPRRPPANLLRAHSQHRPPPRAATPPGSHATPRPFVKPCSVGPRAAGAGAVRM